MAKSKKLTTYQIPGVWISQRKLAEIIEVHQTALSLANSRKRNAPVGNKLYDKLLFLAGTDFTVQLTETDLSWATSRNKGLLKKLQYSIESDTAYVNLYKIRLVQMKKNYAVLDHTRKVMAKLSKETFEKDSVPETEILKHRRRVAKKILTCDLVAQSMLSYKITSMESSIEHSKELMALMKG